MKGIILAGGAGTRLYPITRCLSKQLLPIYDKPMIYYPLSVLMLAGIRDILVISTPEDTPRFEQLLGNGGNGESTSAMRSSPHRKAWRRLLSSVRTFIAGSHCALVLGDNIFYGHDLWTRLARRQDREKGATIFAYPVNDPERYGVVEFDDEGTR